MGEEARLVSIREGVLKVEQFSVDEVAKALGMSKNTLYDEIKAGRLHARKPIGKRRGYRLTVDDINEWNERRMEVI